MYLPGSNGNRPDGTIVIMSCLTYRGSQTAYPNAVTAHNRILYRAIGICIGHVHGFCIFGAKLEDISYLNAPLYLNGLFAAAGTDSSGFDLGHIYIFHISQVTGNVQTFLMVIFFVCSAGQIFNSFQRGVIDDLAVCL